MTLLPKSKAEIEAIFQSVITEESQAISGLLQHLTDDFYHAVELLLQSKGRIIVTGIGKSANIAMKMVATFNSTGSPAVFLHAADAIHGDIGIIQPDDVVVALSKSGNTPEIQVLVPLIKNNGNKIIAIVGNVKSYLARQSDFVLNTSVEREACPNNLAPTSSATAQLVMGDALAVALLECKGFSRSDFARLHPGGTLGKQLYLRAGDLAKNNQLPQVDINDSLSKVIIEITSKRLGATAVLENGKLAGIITDGDLRRMLMKGGNINTLRAKDILTPNPKTIRSDTMVVDALNLMRTNNITQLLVVDNDVYCGVVHLHDILKEGIL